MGKYIKNIEKMICIRCNKKRIKTDDGICFLCRRKDFIGHEVKIFNPKKIGSEVKCKSGNIDENVWMWYIR